MYSRLMQCIKLNYSTNNSPLVKLSMFHDKRGPVWECLKLLAEELDRNKIDYAIIGGIAVYKHGYERTTNDCDILLSKKDFKVFEEQLVGRHVKRKFKGASRKFVCNQTKTEIDVIVEGDHAGGGRSDQIVFPDPKRYTQLVDDIRIISLAKLIEFKLASSKSQPVNRMQDKADVVQLIKSRHLDTSMANSLDASLRSDYLDLIDGLREEKKNPGENEFTIKSNMLDDECIHLAVLTNDKLKLSESNMKLVATQPLTTMDIYQMLCLKF